MSGHWQEWDKRWINAKALYRGHSGPAQTYRQYVRDLLGIMENPSGQKVIEIGAGRGTVAAYLSERGARCTLLDRSPNAIRVAKQIWSRHPQRLNDAEFLQADILDFQTDRVWDWCISVGVLEHFEDVTSVVERCSQLAANNWHVVVLGNGKIKRYDVKPPQYVAVRWTGKVEFWTWRKRYTD